MILPTIKTKFNNIICIVHKKLHSRVNGIIIFMGSYIAYIYILK